MATKAKKIKSSTPQKFGVRDKNRCPLCGRPRGFYRKFNMCRCCLRKLAHEGKLPGVTKASW